MGKAIQKEIELIRSTEARFQLDRQEHFDMLRKAKWSTTLAFYFIQKRDEAAVDVEELREKCDLLHEEFKLNKDVFEQFEQQRSQMCYKTKLDLKEIPPHLQPPESLFRHPVAPQPPQINQEGQ